MSKFQHPHLIRGIVHTPAGAFEVRRGIIDVPDELGNRFGWISLEDAQLFDQQPASQRVKGISQSVISRSTST